MFERMVERQYELIRRERLGKSEPAAAPAEPSSAPVATPSTPTAADESHPNAQGSEVSLLRLVSLLTVLVSLTSGYIAGFSLSNCGYDG